MQFKFICFLLLFSSTLLLAQKSEYNTLSIADSLKENANAIVRLNQIDITISSQRNMNIKTKRVVTVLNEKGIGEIEAKEYYSKPSSVKNIEALVFDCLCIEI